MKDIYFHNAKHLGDCVFMIHYLRKVCAQYDDFRFICQVKKKFFKELKAQINEYSDRILLRRLGPMNENSINGWIGRYPIKGGKRGKVFLLDERYVLGWRTVSELFGIESPIKTKQDMLIDNEQLLVSPSQELNPDILLINSVPLSGQYRYNKKQFQDKVEEWKERYSIVTTYRTECSDVPCTRDYGMNLLEIGNLSLKAKYIVGIATAPIINCFNIWNIDKVEKWFVLSNRSIP